MSITLLGPQRHPTLDRVLTTLGVDGPIATINAGWQEREPDDAELLSLHGGRGLNLRLYARWLDLLAHDGDYARAEREHRVVLDEMQQLYRLRLEHALSAAYEIARTADGHPRTRAAALADALEIVRLTDRMHLDRVHELRTAFEDAWVADREPIAKQRHEIGDILGQAVGLTIAGGHVGDLLHVLRLFAVAASLPKHIVAWSAGAMTLSERVVLFHDRAAQGAAPAQVLDAGLGIVTGIVPLPHARRRLRTDDTVRMAVFAQRFAPVSCLVLDDGVTVELGDGGRLPADARVVTPDGAIMSVGET